MVPYKQFSSADIFDDVQKLLPTFIPKYEQHLNSSMFLIKMSNKLSKFFGDAIKILNAIFACVKSWNANCI